VSTAIAPQVRLAAGALGAEIRGIDLNTLTDEGFARVHAVLLERQVVFVPGQAQLTPEAHIAFGRRFGEVELHPYLPRLDGHPEIVIIDSEDGGKVDVWHTDMTFHQSPPIASILHLIRVPETGGDTMWTNQCLVYEELSAPLRDFLDGLTAIHVIRIGTEFTSRAEHPVVRVHPETGERVLFVNPGFTDHVVGLTSVESRRILDLFYEHLTRPQYTVRFRWHAGDVAFWDNRATSHLAPSDLDHLDVRRTLHRVTLIGDRPVGVDGRESELIAGKPFLAEASVAVA
jgi:taurine dioxygenase